MADIKLDGQTLATASGSTITLDSNLKFPSGHVIKTYQAVKTDTQTIDGAWELITDLTLTITPKLTPTKFLITAMLSHGSHGGSEGMRIRLYKNGAELTAATGDASGARLRVFMHIGSNTGGGEMQTGTGVYLDSNTGSSNVTYAIYGQSYSNSFPSYINRSETDANNQYNSRAISTLTIQEIVP